MLSFWRLLNILISVIGFLIVGGMALYREEPFEIIVLKAVATFAGLYALQNGLGSLLLSVAGEPTMRRDEDAQHERPATQTPGNKAGPEKR